MITIFVSFFAVGFVVLIGSLLFGHDDLTLDADLGGGDEPKIGGVKVVSAFLTAFGAVGSLARWSGVSTLGSSLFAVGGGIVLAGLMYGLLHLAYGQQSSSHVDAARLLGCRGLVSVAIPASGLGEITITVPGGQQTYLARSSSGAIPEGASIQILAMVGEQAVVATEGA